MDNPECKIRKSPLIKKRGGATSQVIIRIATDKLLLGQSVKCTPPIDQILNRSYR